MCWKDFITLPYFFQSWIIISVFVITSAFHLGCIWRFLKNIFQAFLSLPVSFNNFLFFRIFSHYFIPCFSRFSSGKTTTNLEGSKFIKPNVFFHSNLPYSQYFLMLLLFQYSLKCLKTVTSFRPNIAHPPNHCFSLTWWHLPLFMRDKVA